MVFEKMMKMLRIFENTVSSVGLIVTTVLIFAQVINRYWLHFEVMWINDLALYIFVLTVFITVALTTRERGHTAVEMLQEHLFLRRPFAGSIYFLFRSIASLCVAIIFYLPIYKFFLRSIKYPEYGTLVRWFNTSWLVYSMYFMICLIIFHLSVQIVEDLMDVIFQRNRIKGGTRK
ncbi:MAG TPA: TRAP transporter small permease subunit [Synergistales bacterium]|nr:TRAP transporter small permease subunit [Synergistales bacterium]